MKGVQAGSRQTSRAIQAIEAKMNQVPIHQDEAIELFRLIPVERNRILEPPVFEKLLPLKQHRDARRREYDGCRQSCAFLGEPALWVMRINF